MGRWGEEEKKSQGLFGCFIAFAVIGLFGYTFYINYENLEGRRELEKKMQNVVRLGHQKTENQMIADIAHEAQLMELDLGPNDIKLVKRPDGHTNYIVDVEIRYPFDINLLVTSFKMNVPIKESVLLIAW